MSTPNKERKIAVHLSKLDWQVVMGCMLSHVERDRSAGDPVWIAGRHRVMHIVGEIALRLPKDEPK